MPFDDDIFLSYAHMDNQSPGGAKGWVTLLYERLKIRLAQLLGEEPKIWIDHGLQGNQYFTGVLGDRISNTLLLIPVITPRYVNSDWCRGELQEFCRRADRTGGISINNNSRIFKVVKTPVRHEQHPAELQGLLGYEFFEVDAHDRPREFDPEVTPYKDPKYWAKLEDLAWDIKQALEDLRRRTTTAAVVEAKETPLEKKIYLAETTAALTPERERIKRELQQRGHYVLPDKELPLTSPEFEEAVRVHVGRCVLSIHLIGEGYGLIPDGEERSIVELQHEIAAERSGEAGFSRLVWMPVGLTPKGAAQQKFVEALQTRISAGAELLQTSLEDLKTRIQEKLNPPPKLAPTPQQSPAPPDAGNGDADDLKRVYLICDNRDEEAIAPLEDFLWDKGFEVIRSANIGGGDDAQVAQYHRENLLMCDATLIYYGSGNEFWLRSKLWDLQKAPGWGRAAPMRAKAIYVGTPETNEKQRFRTREVPVVVHNFREFTPETLKPFVSALGDEVERQSGEPQGGLEGGSRP